MQFQEIGAIPTQPGFSLLTKAVANDQSLLFLFIEESGSQAVVERQASAVGSFVHPRMEHLKRSRLVKINAGSVQAIDLPELDIAFPYVDVFPDGRTLLAGGRSAWRAANDYDLNGVIFDPVQKTVERIFLGDGISSVQVDSIGRIWVSYFDEGVLGDTLGSSGLVCFSASGEVVWEYPQPADNEISDCYALNVSDLEATIFFYTDFPICRINSQYELTYWKTNLAGCHALAISRTEVLLSGQYKDRHMLRILHASQMGTSITRYASIC